MCERNIVNRLLIGPSMFKFDPANAAVVLRKRLHVGQNGSRFNRQPLSNFFDANSGRSLIE